MSPDKQCKYCEYFERDQRWLPELGRYAFTDGYCVRHAPVIDPARDLGFDYPFGGPVATFPRVTEDMRCGEFEPIPTHERYNVTHRAYMPWGAR